MSFIENLKSWIFSDAASQFVMGMLGALVVVGIINFVPPFEKPRIATVDITGIANRFIAQEARQNLPADVLKKKVTAFGQALEKSVNETARKNSLILVPKEAVMAGAKDVTPLVEKNLQANLQVSQGSIK